MIKIKDFLKELIKYGLIILIALIAVIFSDLTPDKRIYYFKIGLIIVSILILSYVAYIWYLTPDIIERFNRKRRTKKAIRELRRGTEYIHLTVGDLRYILSHQDEFNDLNDFDRLLEYIREQTRRLGETLARGLLNIGERND